MTITPEQADRLDNNRTPGQWIVEAEDIDDSPTVNSLHFRGGLLTLTSITDNGYLEDGDAALIAAAPDLAQTIAGMKTEYALETLWGTGADWAVTTGWFPTPERAWADLVLDAGPTRLVRRVVSETEVVES